MMQKEFPSLGAALDASWPALRSTQVGGFYWRDGGGGGQRVSASRLGMGETPQDADIDLIEAKSLAQGTPAQFQISHDDPAQMALDALLERRNYRCVDPTVIQTGPLAALPEMQPGVGFTAWPPVGLQRMLWAQGGVDAARLAVMERVTLPKTTLLVRNGDLVAGNAFAAIASVEGQGTYVVLHALEVAKHLRRQGSARALLAHLRYWGESMGATRLALQVTKANTAALALYSSLGMSVVGEYHYRTQTN